MDPATGRPARVPASSSSDVGPFHRDVRRGRGRRDDSRPTHPRFPLGGVRAGSNEWIQRSSRSGSTGDSRPSSRRSTLASRNALPGRGFSGLRLVLRVCTDAHHAGRVHLRWLSWGSCRVRRGSFGTLLHTDRTCTVVPSRSACRRAVFRPTCREQKLLSTTYARLPSELCPPPGWVPVPRPLPSCGWLGAALQRRCASTSGLRSPARSLGGGWSLHRWLSWAFPLGFSPPSPRRSVHPTHRASSAFPRSSSLAARTRVRPLDTLGERDSRAILLRASCATARRLWHPAPWSVGSDGIGWRDRWAIGCRPFWVSRPLGR